MKRIISFLLAVIMLASVSTVNTLAASEVASGTCGDNLTWVLTDDGTLTISGTGDMYDYKSSSIPWERYLILDSIKSVIIQDGVTSICNFAFQGCSSLTSVDIGDGVTNISNYAFSGCSNLSSVEIGDSVTSIGGCAFQNCLSLTSISIPDSVTLIDTWAFQGCSSLNNIDVGNGVTTIGGMAFNGCSSLSSINIPSSVTSIGSDAFQNCHLSSVFITDLAAWCNISFTSSSSNPLYNRGGLVIDDELQRDLVIPEGVTSIKWYAFVGDIKLESVTIPNSVTSICSSAFYGCSHLTSITILNANTWIYDSEDTISDTATIYGHEGSTAEAYAMKYNRKFNLIGATHECSFAPWEVYGWQSHIRYCTVEGCTVFEKNAHSFSSETDLSCNVCGYGNAEPDFTGDGSLDKNDAIYLLYHVLFGAESYPLTK